MVLRKPVIETHLLQFHFKQRCIRRLCRKKTFTDLYVVVRGGQGSGIAVGSEQFSAGVSGLVKKTLDCAVRAFIIPILFTDVATDSVTC